MKNKSLSVLKERKKDECLVVTKRNRNFISERDQVYVGPYIGHSRLFFSLNLFFPFFFFFLRLIALQYCISFAIRQHESATLVHIFPVLNPPPTFDFIFAICLLLFLFSQWCPTLCDPMDCRYVRLPCSSLFSKAC